MFKTIGKVQGAYDYSEIDLFWEYEFYKANGPDAEIMVLVCDADKIQAVSVQNENL